VRGETLLFFRVDGAKHKKKSNHFFKKLLIRKARWTTRNTQMRSNKLYFSRTSDWRKSFLLQKESFEALSFFSSAKLLHYDLKGRREREKRGKAQKGTVWEETRDVRRRTLMIDH